MKAFFLSFSLFLSMNSFALDSQEPLSESECLKKSLELTNQLANSFSFLKKKYADAEDRYQKAMKLAQVHQNSWVDGVRASRSAERLWFTQNQLNRPYHVTKVKLDSDAKKMSLLMSELEQCEQYFQD